MLKRLAVIALLLMLILSGCAAKPEQPAITVVAAIFPEYDWVRQILGPDSGIELKLLVDDGVDPHSFQPTAADLVAVSTCDLLIFGGGESDAWLEDALQNQMNPNMHVLELLPLLGESAHTAVVKEGMQTREDEEETDEHVWLSLPNAMRFCTAVCEELKQLDPGNAGVYEKNLEAYLAGLSALDAQYRQVISQSPKNTILVCDRFPYRYLTEDYGLDYYAAFPGCSSESGASFRTVVFLTDKVRELELNAVIIPEGSDGRLAATVAANSGRENVAVLTLDSMQAVSLKDAAKRDYRSIMEQNLAVLKEALK